jgi:hypothetical protein
MLPIKMYNIAITAQKPVLIKISTDVLLRQEQFEECSYLDFIGVLSDR